MGTSAANVPTVPSFGVSKEPGEKLNLFTLRPLE